MPFEPPSNLRTLANRGARRLFKKGDLLIREGEKGDEIFIIMAGRVKVFGKGEDGREIVYNECGAGEYIGEMALDERPRSASVMAIEATQCSVVNRDTLKKFIAEHPDFAFELIGKIIERVRLTTRILKNVALLDVYGRIAALLTDLAIEQDGKRFVPVFLSQQEIADRVGSSREMVGKLLKDLVAGHYIEFDSERRIRLRGRLPHAH